MITSLLSLARERRRCPLPRSGRGTSSRRAGSRGTKSLKTLDSTSCLAVGNFGPAMAWHLSEPEMCGTFEELERRGTSPAAPLTCPSTRGSPMAGASLGEEGVPFPPSPPFEASAHARPPRRPPRPPPPPRPASASCPSPPGWFRIPRPSPLPRRFRFAAATRSFLWCSALL